MIARTFRRNTYATIVALVPLVAVAEPVIQQLEGAVGEGETLTIHGQSFGTHGGYNDGGYTWHGRRFINFRWKDMEDAQLNSDGFYSQRGDSAWNPSSAELGIRDGGPAGSTYYMSRTHQSVESGGISARVEGAGNQFYTTFKFMIEPNTQSGKFFRLYADGPNQYTFLSVGCIGDAIRGDSAIGDIEWGQGPQLTGGVWHRLEVWLDASVNEVSVWVDGEKSWTQTSWLASQLAANGHTVDYPNMIDEPGSFRCSSHPTWNGSYNYDDIFIDFTEARVELGDAPAWGDVRKKEIQIPVQWGDSAITVAVNTGEFPPGQLAYLFVVDQAGRANQLGYPVTIGTGSTVPLSAPTAVKVDVR